jgi:hypothetical protein
MACKYIGIPFNISVDAFCVRTIRTQKPKMTENTAFCVCGRGGVVEGGGERKHKYVIDGLKETHRNIQSCQTEPF